MALTTLPKAFKTNFEKSPKFENHLGAEVTNINIWVPSSFSHNFLYISQMVYK